MNSDEKFNNNRLKFARTRRGLKIKTLCEKLGITTRTYSNYENAQREPSIEIINGISELLNFPVSFFFLDDPVDLDTASVSFRSLARMSASTRDQALRAGQIALEFSAWLDKHFVLPEAELMDLRNYEPEAAADTLRCEWNIGELSIKNIVHLIEAKGVRVFSLEENTMDLDGFSFWEDDTPFIFLNTRKSVERSRFDAAHELGHLVLHRQGSASGKEVEAEANAFASAFLMPKGSVISRSHRFLTLRWIIANKYYWRVSAAALVRRLKDLELISEWQYRNLNIELSKQGHMKNEPNPIKEKEFSKLFPMIFQSLRNDNIRKQDIAKELGLYSDEINKLLFNLTITELPGKNINAGSKLTKANLKVVK